MNPTPSQPERPEPPKGFRLMEQSELTAGCIMPNDALIWEESESPQWEPSCFQGENLPCRQTGIYATRTPAPEAVAGERNDFDTGAVARQKQDESRQFMEAMNKGGGEKCPLSHVQSAVDSIPSESLAVGCNAPADVQSVSQGQTTPPVEADKDAEIAKGHIDSVRLADKLLTRTAKGFDYLVSFGGGRGPDVWDNERTVNGVDIHDALSQARGLVEDSDGWIFRIEQNDYPPTTREKLESDLTTARATIAERDKRIERLVGALRELLRKATDAYKRGENATRDLGTDLQHLVSNL